MVILLLLVGSRTTWAQDVNFTQFYADKIYLNPALTGSGPCKRIFSSYRNQWPALRNSFVTYTLSYDQEVEGMHGGIGLRVMHDSQGSGLFSRTEVGGAYSFQFALNKNTAVLMGVYAAGFGFSQNVSGLVFPNQLGPNGSTLPSTETLGKGATSFDFAAGAAIYSDFYYAGVAVHHLATPVYYSAGHQDVRMPRKITAHAGLKYVVEADKRFGYETFSISPNLIFQYQANEPVVNYGVYVQYTAFVFGTWLRQVDWAAIGNWSLLLGFDLDTWRMGYSYDINTSQIGPGTGGSHELTASYLFGCQKKPKYKGVGTITCPAF